MMMVYNIFGGGGPIFGGARLPNGLGTINRGKGLWDRIVPKGTLVRRAVGTWQTLGPGLGTRFGFCQTQRWHTSWVLRDCFDRSGASPRQSSAGASHLMTNIKTFVPYF